MSDEPSDAQKLIAEVVRKHRRLPGTVTGPQYCSCVWSGLDYPAHVAAEVDKALGGLTPEWGVAYDGGYSVEETYETEQEAHAEANSRCLSCDTCRNAFPKHVEARFVSGWTVTE